MSTQKVLGRLVQTHVVQAVEVLVTPVIDLLSLERDTAVLVGSHPDNWCSSQLCPDHSNSSLANLS